MRGHKFHENVTEITMNGLPNPPNDLKPVKVSDDKSAYVFFSCMARLGFIMGYVFLCDRFIIDLCNYVLKYFVFINKFRPAKKNNLKKGNI